MREFSQVSQNFTAKEVGPFVAIDGGQVVFFFGAFDSEASKVGLGFLNRSNYQLVVLVVEVAELVEQLLCPHLDVELLPGYLTLFEPEAVDR